MSVLAGVIVVAFLVLVGKLFGLQVVNRLEYEERAEAVASRSTPLHAERGRIYDRNYDTPLVTNRDSFAIEVVPGEISRDSLQSEFQRIAQFVGVDVQEIRAKIKPRYYGNFQPFEIRSGVPREKIFYLAEHLEDFPGVHWQSKPARQYLIEGSMSHVVGYVDTITAEEYRVLYNRGYTLNSVVGKSGIEKQYDAILRGKDGASFQTVDVKGKAADASGGRIVPPEPGNDIVLTIDRRIQALCEAALGRRKGSVVVLQPGTGEILALVSYPWFDPRVFARRERGEEFTELALDPESPFLNRAVQSSYPPASVFKLVLTAGILEEDLFDTERLINCTGSIRVGDRLFRCWKRAGHGLLDLEGGLAHSCDVYFWTVALEAIGVERILRYADMFGLGWATGVDLPREVKGFLPSPQWKEQRFHSPWVGGDTLNMAIGQGWTLVTPLQIANMVAMIVNEGATYRPHVVRQVRDPKTGDLIERRQPEVLRRAPLKPETWKGVKSAMRAVVTEGTARYVLTTEAVEAAGKTGTGEIGLEEDFHSWFVAYAPFETDNPLEQVVVVVMVEAGEGGYEWWSPKAGNAILQGIFANQSYQEAARALNLWYLLENQQGD
jgi:penicillin-binding protein 2